MLQSHFHYSKNPAEEKVLFKIITKSNAHCAWQTGHSMNSMFLTLLIKNESCQLSKSGQLHLKTSTSDSKRDALRLNEHVCYRWLYSWL